MGGFGRSMVPDCDSTSAQRHQPGRTQKCRAEEYAGATQPTDTLSCRDRARLGTMLIEVNVIASMPERCFAYFAIRRHIQCIQSG
jgi:hypothetical protein